VLVSADHDGKTFAAEIRAALAQEQIAPVFELTVDPDLPDPGSLADRVRAFAPDALVMRLRPAAVRRMLAALQSVGVDCAVFLPWIPGLRLGEFPASFAGPVAEAIPFEPPQQCGPYLKLVRAGIQRHGAKPTAPMVYGYDGASLVIEALRRTTGGRTDLQRQLTELSGFWGASGPIRWDNGGGNAALPAIQIIEPD
jgi:ABC-type branched-subunit amino acid transport system substrate-binding protein